MYSMTVIFENLLSVTVIFENLLIVTVILSWVFEMLQVTVTLKQMTNAAAVLQAES